MPIRIVVPKETREGERRVAIDPATAARFRKLGATLAIQRGAGLGAQMLDESFAGIEGLELIDDAGALLGSGDVVLKVLPPSAEEVELMQQGAVVVALLQPHQNPDMVARLRDRKLTAFAMEFLPRISRAQSMDVLSSQASVSGYKAALIAANLASFFFPMLTTAAGTIRPAKVLVVGAGVAGLQAIATARRLGAMVEAYDIRPAAREQVESLGAKMVDTGVNAEGGGGYARELTAEEEVKQAEALGRHVAAASAVITTASIPGRPAPRIITQEMVAGMRPGAVIVDLAAESGGNCELTRPGTTVEVRGVTIAGPLNVASSVPLHASEMYAKNLFNFLSPAIKDGELALDWEDQVIAETALTHGGEIRHAAIREQIG
jgi:NAD(P) transhydrogenase subunit alpha